MTKQSIQQQPKEGHSIADEELNDDLILHCWNGVQDQIKRVVEFNRSQGVPNPEQFIGYGYAPGTPEPMDVKQKLRFLKIIKHKRTGEFLTLDNLISSGTVSEMEREVFGSQKIPRIEMSAMTRVKTQEGSEYLVRQMRVYGLSEIGALITLPLADADFTRKVPISPGIAKSKDGNDVKILQVGTGEFYYPTSPKIYTTKFTRENVMASLQRYPPGEETHGKITHAFKKDGVTNEVGIDSLEEFLSEDFESVWNSKRQQAPQININSKDLATFVKLDRESKTDHKQYS